MPSLQQCSICLGSNCFLPSSTDNDTVVEEEDEEVQKRECCDGDDDDEEKREDSTSIVVTRVPGIVLNKCNHGFCKPCIESWFLHQENGNFTLGDRPLTCPECRAVVNNEDIVTVLGRPLRHVISDDESEEGRQGQQGSYDDEMDEFTLAYLEAQAARQCPDCGILIIRGDGCKNVMCRCGCRFCFCCGDRGNCCGSTFFNNIILEEEQYVYDWDPDTESVAGMVVPLFAANLDFGYDDEDGEHVNGDWYDYWCPPTIEYFPYRIMPLFEEDWYIDGNVETADVGVSRLANFWRITTRDQANSGFIPYWYTDMLRL